MAEIRPFKAWRYNNFLGENLAELTAPLSESVLKQKQRAFYKLPYHHFHISSPLDVPPFYNSTRRVANWKLDKVIIQDPLPTFYVYAQHFKMKGTGEKCIRKGIITLIKAEDFDKQVVLPHEKTIAKAVDYRTNLLMHTLMHSLPTHGFYTDTELSIEQYLDESLQHPIYEVKDKQDTIHQLAQIQDLNIINQIIHTLADKQVWIADGHHRYESSVQFKKRRAESQPGYQGDEGFNYHMMWLTNTQSSSLGLLPTHRMIHSLENFNQEVFVKELEKDFILKPIKNNDDFGLAPTENLWTFRLVLPEKHFIIQLKPESFANFKADLPDAVKKLDLSVMHYFIFERILGLKAQVQFDYLDFSQYYSRCLQQVNAGEANFALITRRITLEEIEKVCLSGYTMPAKSTYFYPKVLGGLVFGSVEESEFI